MSRLSTGGLIDRTRPLKFTFDGKQYSGFEGDTLAAALLANEVRLVARSFKYHRPRGILTAGTEEPNALVTLREGARAEPNSKATAVPLYDGLVASSQNRWPSLGFDLLALNQLASPIFVAGFYYKTFMRPAALWEKLYEPLIRRAAGLGALSGLPDPDSYDRKHAFCDLLVIGAGPSGLAAALTAGRSGLRVILADDDMAMGGHLLKERSEIAGAAGADWAAGVVEELASYPNVTLLPRTGVFGVYDGHEYGAVERVSDHLPEPLPGQPRQRFWKIVARHALLASGAIERPLIFPGNDRPGVMMASAVSAYLNRFAVAPGKKAAIFTSCDTGWQTALDLQAAGIGVAAVVDTRAQMPALADRLDLSDCVVALQGAIVDIKGSKSVKGATIRDGSGKETSVVCDLVAMSGGWNPAIGLGSNFGNRPVWSEELNAFLLDKAPPGFSPVGSAAGRMSLTSALGDGIRAATEVVQQLGKSPAEMAIADVAETGGTSENMLWVPSGIEGKAFVDFQNDVTASDIKLAASEGFVSIEHLKRYTTMGMATDQGKLSQLNGHGLLAEETKKTIAEAGTIMSRPPYTPIALGVIAGHHRGEHFRPVRHTASHDWAAENGAAFVDVGQWKRAQWFVQPGETEWRTSVDREVKATRGGVGICDVSTLGKIDVLGPDAATLLDRLYANMFSTLPVGRARYGLMLREDGFVMDDGTATRFAEDRYYVTTTTANAARVMQHIDFARQVIWPELDVQATSVTEQWATYSIAGPQSRAVLQALLPDIDLTNEAFKFMAAGEYRWRGTKIRLFRVSFSGELAYEISIGANRGRQLLEAIMEAGAPFGIVPYGTEALGVMRIEKGHPAGNEMNGQTTAGDLGMGRMLSTKKDFIGRAMAQRPGLTDPGRMSLVGLKPIDPAATLRAGAHLLAKGAEPKAANVQGRVTSAAFSPTLGYSIALALVTGGQERIGEEMLLNDIVRATDVPVEICDAVFVDPAGERLRG